MSFSCSCDCHEAYEDALLNLSAAEHENQDLKAQIETIKATDKGTLILELDDLRYKLWTAEHRLRLVRKISEAQLDDLARRTEQLMELRAKLEPSA